MKGRKNVLKTKVRSSNNIYSKILACCILVAIFTGYLMPMKILAAPFWITEEVTKDDEYIDLGDVTTDVRQSLKKQFQWKEFSNKSDKRTNTDGTTTYVMHSYPRTENDKSESFEVPRAWIEWCKNKGLNTYTIDSDDEELGAFDYSKFDAINTIEVKNFYNIYRRQVL